MEERCPECGTSPRILIPIKMVRGHEVEQEWLPAFLPKAGVCYFCGWIRRRSA
jgi:hypothetical protein